MKTLIDIKIRQSQIHQEHLTISVASYSIYLLYDMDFNIYIYILETNQEIMTVYIFIYILSDLNNFYSMLMTVK